MLEAPYWGSLSIKDIFNTNIQAEDETLDQYFIRIRKEKAATIDMVYWRTSLYLLISLVLIMGSIVISIGLVYTDNMSTLQAIVLGTSSFIGFVNIMTLSISTNVIDALRFSYSAHTIMCNNYLRVLAVEAGESRATDLGISDKSEIGKLIQEESTRISEHYLKQARNLSAT